MTRGDRTIREIDLELLKEINHICDFEQRNQGAVINEGMMLWLERYNERKKAKKVKK